MQLYHHENAKNLGWESSHREGYKSERIEGEVKKTEK